MTDRKIAVQRIAAGIPIHDVFLPGDILVDPLGNPIGGSVSFKSLVDVNLADYVGHQGKLILVKPTEDGLELFPSTFSGKAGYLLAVKSGEDGVELISQTLVKEGIKYFWADETAKLAQTGMSDGEMGVQQDEHKVYWFNDPGDTGTRPPGTWDYAFDLDNPGGDTDAIHDNVAGEIAAISEKADPVPNDLLIAENSEDLNNKVGVKIGNLPAMAGILVLDTLTPNPTFADIKNKLVIGDTDTAGGDQTITLPVGVVANDGNAFAVQRDGANLLTVAAPPAHLIKISGGGSPLDFPDDGDSAMFIYRHATKTYHVV